MALDQRRRFRYRLGAVIGLVVAFVLAAALGLFFWPSQVTVIGYDNYRPDDTVITVAALIGPTDRVVGAVARETPTEVVVEVKARGVLGPRAGTKAVKVPVHLDGVIGDRRVLADDGRVLTVNDF